MVSCGKCGHSFDTLVAGFAGVSLVPEDGWMGDTFRQFHLCPPCRDTLRSWLGVPPAGVDPSDLEWMLATA